MAGAVFVAIGDVHGEADRLKRMHRLILQRWSEAWAGRRLHLVHLGDYVDRGPDSFGVIEAIMALGQTDGLHIVNLRGNHEQMMIEALDDTHSTARSTWLRNGGEETLESYRAAGHSDVPDHHVSWLRALPTLHRDMPSQMIFVHAGIDVDTYPDARPDVHMWTRSRRFFDTRKWKNPALKGWTVVHGHTPTHDFLPECDGAPVRRINIDTGAVYGGRLTAAIFVPGEEVRFLYA